MTNGNIGHGHVFPRPDGVKMRCGGPPSCSECARDLARKMAADTPPVPAADATVDAVPVALKDCPVGLFISEHGSLCLKTEYGNNEGRIDAYIVESGEFFWGGTNNATEQREAMVTPHVYVATPPAPVPGGGEVVEEAHSQAEMLLLAIEANDPKPELAMRVRDMLATLSSPQPPKGQGGQEKPPASIRSGE